MKRLFLLGLFAMTAGLSACSSTCDKGEHAPASVEEGHQYKPSYGEQRRGN